MGDIDTRLSGDEKLSNKYNQSDVTDIRGSLRKPAVGLDATGRESDIETFARVVDQAREHDAHVIVVAEATDTNLCSRMRWLGVTVLEISEPASVDPVEKLCAVGKEMGFPGVLIHTTPESELQYPERHDRFQQSNQYASQARVAEQKSDATVIAGITASPQDAQIERLVKGARDYVDEVLVVETDTHESTPRGIKESDATVIKHEPNDSSASCIQYLFQHVERHFSELDALVLLGEDSQLALAEIPELVDSVTDEDADLVVGRRTDTDDNSKTQDFLPIGQRLRDSFTMGPTEQRQATFQAEVLALAPAAISQLKDHTGSVEDATGLIETAIRANLTVRECELQADVDTDTSDRAYALSGSRPGRSAGPEQTVPANSGEDWQLSREVAPNTDRPAVGLAVTPGIDSDAVAGAVLRACRNGHDMLIGAVKTADTEAVAFADALGARIINVQADGDGAETPDPRAVLTNAAREAGYPGLLWQTDPKQRINFTQSVAELTDAATYCHTPTEQPTVEPQPHVLVAIPAYNEADTIGDVVSASQPHADDVLVVDDGSDDTTAATARNAGATVIEHASNKGYGATLKTAFREADRSDAAHLVILDGDGQHDPSEIPRLVRTQRERDTEIVTGSRFEDGSETDLPVYRRLGLSVVNLVTNFSLGVVRPSSRVKDTQCGFRVYGSQAIESITADSAIGSHMGASTDILHHAHRQDYQIEEVPTTVDYAVEDGSTRNPVSHGVTLIMNLLRTIERDRPITAIGVPGLISVVIGMGFAYWTISNYLQSATFPLGLAVTSTLFLLSGTFACFAAIILHSLSTHLSKE